MDFGYSKGSGDELDEDHEEEHDPDYVEGDLMIEESQRSNSSDEKTVVEPPKTAQKNKTKVKSRTPTPQNDVPDQPTPRVETNKWKSANAFINFVQDFKDGSTDSRSGRNIFQICGERWKTMTDEQKQPYITAANSVKKMKTKKVVDKDKVEVKAKKTPGRVSKHKAEAKRKQLIQKRSKVVLTLLFLAFILFKSL